ncbi:MAG: universal stress protein [Candidatus Obscuribacterales bacterium]|nr:universal stress protein [Candidatus Obscuribacterales bacterium]
MKILLPVYSSDDAKLIVDFVCNYRWPPHPSFALIHVVDDTTNDKTAGLTRSSAESLIAVLVKRLTALLPAAEISWKIVSGETVLEIVTMANNWEADMIVMGYRKRNGIHDCAIASVSKAVAMQAPCSVAIISPPKHRSARSLDNSIAAIH